MNNMLESTLKVFDKRKHELPSAENVGFMVEYFEEGCLCIDGGDLPIPDQPNEVKALYYLMWCGCNRHPDYEELKHEQP